VKHRLTGSGDSPEAALILRRKGNMKRAISMCSLLALMLAAISLATFAEGKTMTWTGWISDSHCGAKGMSADHKACAQTCIKTKGASWVFVSSKTKKVLPIKNQDAVNADDDLGAPVKVTGHVTDDGSIQVDKITKSGA
jgi:hypothetical protein